MARHHDPRQRDAARAHTYRVLAALSLALIPSLPRRALAADPPAAPSASPSSSSSSPTPPPATPPSAPASASAPAPAPKPTTPSSDNGEVIQECPTCRPHYWTRAPARAFISIRADVGYLYLKPRFSFGYGQPFARWVGLDAVPFATPDSVGGYAGLRFQYDWFEVRGGGRLVHAFNRQYLLPQDSYSLVDTAQDNKRVANYLSLEGEVSAAIPAGPGAIVALAGFSYLTMVQAGYYVYDETLRIIVNPPWVYRGRLGYLLQVEEGSHARIGVVGEVLDVPNRNLVVFRAGFMGSIDITDHLQVIATVVAPILVRDSIGLLAADYTELGIRYRWSTGEAHVGSERNPAAGTTAMRDFMSGL